MLYTIGNRKNYMDAIREHGSIQKLGMQGKSAKYPNGYSGGYAFRTRDDAERCLMELGKQGSWAVFGIVADWRRDTHPAIDGWWHYLTHDADIVILG